MRTIFKGGTVFDSVSGKALADNAVVIEGKKIVEVTPTPNIDSNTRVVNISGKTIIPGIIDTHVHFAIIYTGYMVNHPYVRNGYIAAKTVWAMERMLGAGVTTGRDLGGLDAGFVDAEEEGLITAPRLIGNAVQFLMPTNGTIDALPGIGGTKNVQGNSIIPPGLPAPHCDGPWECRKKAREVLLMGADVIKIGSGGCLAMRQYSHLNPTFTREEIDVFVDEARRQNVKIHCHVLGGKGLEDAIHAGVDSIEHGCLIDDRLIDEMAKRRIWWVPTFWIIKLHSKIDPTQAARDDMKYFYDSMAANLGKAHRAGVPIAMGSDGGAHDEDNTASQLELEYMADSGMSIPDVIIAATRGGAELIGIDDKVGTVEAGKEADLIIVDGDPLKDIRVLQNKKRLSLILKAGKPVGGTWLTRELTELDMNNGKSA